MKNMEINKSKRNLLLFTVSELFYLIFAFVDKYHLYLDSQSYIKMHEMREPLYPTIIAVIRAIFGGNGSDEYLLFVVIFQALLIGYVAYNVTKYFSDEFKLNNISTFIVFLIIISVSLMNRFLAKRGAMYSNSIMSEGIAYPLFILFFRYCYEYINTYKVKSLLISNIISFLFVSSLK